MFVRCTDRKYWHIDDVQYCEDEDEWISPESTDDYFRSDWDGELYHNKYLCTTVDGESVTYQEMKDSGEQWKSNSQGEWYKEEEEECIA